MTYSERQKLYLAVQAQNAAHGAAVPEDGIFQLLPRDAFRLIAVLESAVTPVPPHLLQNALERINQRRDCADFVLVALLRTLLRPQAASRLTQTERAAIAESARSFCYWYDQRDAHGLGIQGMCFHTENHQILFHTAELRPRGTFATEYRRRFGVSPDEAEAAGIDLENLDDSLLFWGVQNARHPRLRKTAFALATAAEDSWLQNFIAEAETLENGDVINTVLGPVDVLTYQTPHYQLSCAQDFRPGGLGYQQHVWQATLSTDAVVFTNQPGGYSQSSAHSERPNFWAGNKWLPRAAQHKNVLFCLHHAPADAPLPFSHAYFPRKAFDQVQENGNWVFARLGESYLALYSQKKPHWHGDDELRAEAHENIWLCELGDEATFGNFAVFCDAVSTMKIAFDEALQINYISPTLGRVIFGWSEPFTVNGEEIALHGYPRPEIPR